MLAQKRFPTLLLNRLTIAERSAAAAIAAGLIAALIEPLWAVIPLAAFLLLCLVAPFMPRFGFYLPVISRGISGKPIVALTFDDGPDPLTTPVLLRLLEKYDATATFFVTGRRAEAYPELILAILRQGHALGNHSFNHDPLIMFKGIRRIKKEIQSTQETLQRFGVTPLVFRPPIGITYPALDSVLKQCNLCAVNFSRRAFDRGNRSIKGLARRILSGVKADDIIMLHDVAPARAECLEAWAAQVETILAGLRQSGLKVRPLADLIKKPISEPVEKSKI